MIQPINQQKTARRLDHSLGNKYAVQTQEKENRSPFSAAWLVRQATDALGPINAMFGHETCISMYSGHGNSGEKY